MQASIVLLLGLALVAAHASRVPLEPKQDRTVPEGWTKSHRRVHDDTISLIFAVKHENTDLLEKIFWDVSMPDSAEYGNHLTLAEIDAIVKPSQERVDAVMAWLKEHEVTECLGTQSNSFLTCTMPVRIANKLLGTHFALYTHGQMKAYRAEEMYTVPSHIAAHLDFVGNVHRFPKIQHKSAKPSVTNEKGDVARTTLPPHIGITPAVLRAWYNISTTVGQQPSNVQSVAQFLGQYFHPSDLTTFWELFGATFPHLDDVTKYIGPDTGLSGTEACLDVEYIMSTGANISTWFWSTGDPHEGQENFLLWIQDVANTTDAPFVHSVSYGDVESSLDISYMDRINQEFQILGGRGLSILFASGDDGAGCASDVFVPNYPASSPYVTAVGGTLLGYPLGEQANYISGGGFSNVFGRPVYQEAAVANFLNTSQNLPNRKYYNHTSRAYPDIAAASSGFTVVVNDLPMPGVAGTSCAAPTSSGIMSLLNDIRIARNQATLGFLNPLLYQYPNALRDITQGCNGGCGRSGVAFCAQAGWDPVTGLGSPNFTGLKQII